MGVEGEPETEPPTAREATVAHPPPGRHRADSLPRTATPAWKQPRAHPLTCDHGTTAPRHHGRTQPARSEVSWALAHTARALLHVWAQGRGSEETPIRVGLEPVMATAAQSPRLTCSPQEHRQAAELVGVKGLSSTPQMHRAWPAHQRQVMETCQSSPGRRSPRGRRGCDHPTPATQTGAFGILLLRSRK